MHSILPVLTEVGAWLAGASGAAVVGLIAGAATAIVVKIVTLPFSGSKGAKA